MSLVEGLLVKGYRVATFSRKPSDALTRLQKDALDTYGKMGVLAKLRKKWFEDKSWVAALP